jgi:hypothetical protein
LVFPRTARGGGGTLGFRAENRKSIKQPIQCTETAGRFVDLIGVKPNNEPHRNGELRERLQQFEAATRRREFKQGKN